MSEELRRRGSDSQDQTLPTTPERNVAEEVREQFDRFLEMRATIRKLMGSRRREILSRLLS